MFFLSDYGTADEFVGVVHAVLHRLAPSAPVIDLGHQIPPFDVAAAAALLVRAGPHLGPGVVLAVVDPGVGTDRRGVAVELPPGGPTWLVGPDNGLLLPLAEARCGPRRRGPRARPPRCRAGRHLQRTATSSPRPPPTWSGAGTPPSSARRLIPPRSPPARTHFETAAVPIRPAPAW